MTVTVIPTGWMARCRSTATPTCAPTKNRIDPTPTRHPLNGASAHSDQIASTEAPTTFSTSATAPTALTARAGW